MQEFFEKQSTMVFLLYFSLFILSFSVAEGSMYSGECVVGGFPQYEEATSRPGDVPQYTKQLPLVPLSHT